MAKTQVSDVIVPEIFVPYSVQRSTQLSRLFQSGIVQTDPELDEIASGGGNTFNLPYWNDLSGSSEGLSDSGSLTPAKISAEKDVAVKHFRGKAWEANDLAGALAGDDPMMAIADLTAAFWNRAYQQDILIPSLTGLFASALSGTHVHDIAIEDGNNAAADNLISGDAILDTVKLLGDHWDNIVAIAVHSVQFFRMKKLDLLEEVSLQEQDITIQTYLGREVITDDSLPTEAGGTSGTKYTAYLFGRGSVGFGNGGPEPDKAVETDRDILAGDDVMTNRRHFIMHPRGVAWTGTAAGQTPTTGELETGGNWTKRWDDKNIRILKLVTNG